MDILLSAFILFIQMSNNIFNSNLERDDRILVLIWISQYIDNMLIVYLSILISLSKYQLFESLGIDLNIKQLLAQFVA